MDQSKLRAWWAHRQGLDGGLAGKSAAEVLERAGWARSISQYKHWKVQFTLGFTLTPIDNPLARGEITR